MSKEQIDALLAEQRVRAATEGSVAAALVAVLVQNDRLFSKRHHAQTHAVSMDGSDWVVSITRVRDGTPPDYGNDVEQYGE